MRELGEYKVSIPKAASAVAMKTCPRPVQICLGSWLIGVIQWMAGVVYDAAIGEGGDFGCSLTDGTLEFVEVLGVSASVLFTAFALISQLDGKDRTFLDSVVMEFKPNKVNELFLDVKTALHVMLLTNCNTFVSGPNLEHANGVMGRGPVFDYSVRGHMLFTNVNKTKLWEAIETCRGGKEMAISVSRYGVLQMEEKEEQNIQTMGTCATGAFATVAEGAHGAKTGRQMLKNDQLFTTAL